MTKTRPPFPLFFRSSSSKSEIHPAAVEVTSLPREQVYVLQKRNSQGYFVQVARFNKTVSIEYVKKEFGDGYYVLRSCIPRFSTIWKGWVGEPKSKSDLPTHQTREIQSLKHTTDNLALGEIVLGVGEVLGFALTGSSLADHGIRLNRAEAILQVYNTSNRITVLCPTCQHTLNNILDDYCSNCGTKTNWTPLPQTDPSGRFCPYCFYPAKPDQYFCSHCGKALPAWSPNGSSARIVPFHPWSLP